jgi:hypothetical protein
MAEAWPLAVSPADPSSAPWAQVMRLGIAARRLESWALWNQLQFIGRLLVAWQESPPVCNGEPGSTDRCADTDPALAERLAIAAADFQRAVKGHFLGHAAQLAAVYVAAELSAGWGIPQGVAKARVEAAEALLVTGRLPRLARLLQAGWVDWPQVQTFLRETSHLEPAVARAVEAVVLGDVELEGAAGFDVVDSLADAARPGAGIPVVARWTVPKLRLQIRAAILQLKARAAEKRAEQARRDRHVRCQAGPDGTAELTAELPAEAAAAIFESLTRAARAAKAAGDPRTLDQLRADELVYRALQRSTTGAVACAAPTGTDVGVDTRADDASRADDESENEASDSPAETRPPGVRSGMPAASTLVSLTIPLSTFLGLSDTPGCLDGHGPIVAALARRIAADAARDHPRLTAWRCIVTDDVHGTVLGVTDPIRTPLHDPPPRLANLVRAMEPRCVFPGCRQPARRCDVDHRIPYPAGQTCACNLQALCRTHHRLKTVGALRVRVLDQRVVPGVAPGTLEWTLPSGLTLRQAPHAASPAPLDTDHPDVLAARAHLDDTEADSVWAPSASAIDDDWATAAWLSSQRHAARDCTEARLLAAASTSAGASARTADDEPPF